MHELSAIEMSALCSNLARGCEKQYKQNESVLFTKLAGYFKSEAAPAKDVRFESLLSLIEEDLSSGFPEAKAVATDAADRGTLRALVWSEKVTRILKTLLTRYAQKGEAMLENTGIFVCTICGFMYLGDTPPEVCPVCKAPGWKFEKENGR